MRGNLYKCDDCGRQTEFTSYIKARASGWAISKDYKKCYCPSCAPGRRRGAAAAVRNVAELPEGWKQINFDELK